jgi:hypothetical protein
MNTKRSGEAERSGEGGSGVSTDDDTTQHAHAHNNPSAVKGNSSDGNSTQHTTKRELKRLQAVYGGFALKSAGAAEDKKSKLMCVFSLFCCAYTPSGGWKEQNQPQPEGKRHAWPVVSGFSPKTFPNIFYSYP